MVNLEKDPATLVLEKVPGAWHRRSQTQNSLNDVSLDQSSPSHISAGKPMEIAAIIIIPYIGYQVAGTRVE
jgi:hypothetical protein